jgi:plastocyanin
MPRVPNRLILGGALLLPMLAFAPSPEPTTLNGTIEGRVELSPRPARRVASRYPGAGGGSHVVGSVPVVAYLRGAIPGSPATAPAQRPRLAQQDTSFRPPLLVVPVGTRVDFPNGDSFFHNVFSYSSIKRFDLGRYPRGESRTVTFDRAGVVKVYCEIHQWMRSAVVVVENPFHTEVAADGRFRIAGVPPGSYTLVVWDVDRGERTAPVTVPATGSVRVDVRL